MAAGLSAGPVAAGGGDGSRQAICAGMADALFDQYVRENETDLLDDMAAEAHIFFSLARRLQGGRNGAQLHLDRQTARADLARRMEAGDDVHTQIQMCSDLRQQMAGLGEFIE